MNQKRKKWWVKEKVRMEELVPECGLRRDRGSWFDRPSPACLARHTVNFRHENEDITMWQRARATSREFWPVLMARQEILPPPRVPCDPARDDWERFWMTTGCRWPSVHPLVPGGPALSANLTVDNRQRINSPRCREWIRKGRGFDSFRRPMMAEMLSSQPVSATVISHDRAHHCIFSPAALRSAWCKPFVLPDYCINSVISYLYLYALLINIFALVGRRIKPTTLVVHVNQSVSSVCLCVFDNFRTLFVVVQLDHDYLGQVWSSRW